MSTKAERVTNANDMLASIAKYGRQFFKHKGRTSRFEVDPRGMVWFIDSWRGARIYTHYHGRWIKFTHGGTMRSLVDDIVIYIRTGKAVRRGHFGQWPGWLAGGDLWGYGKPEMHRLRKELSLNPALSKPLCDRAQMPAGESVEEVLG